MDDNIFGDTTGKHSDDVYDLLLQQVHDFSFSCQHQLDTVALLTAANLPEPENVAMMLKVLGGADGVLDSPGRLLAVTILLARFCNFLITLATVDEDGAPDDSLRDTLLAALLSNAPEVNADWIAQNGEPR